VQWWFEVKHWQQARDRRTEEALDSRRVENFTVQRFVREEKTVGLTLSEE
jgi:hypothetical protein